MSASAMKSLCFWPPESVMNQASRFSIEAELFEQPVAVDGPRIERRPEIDRFPDLDPLLQLRFLELDTDAVLQRVDVARTDRDRARNGASIGRRSPSTHSIVVVFPAPLGPIRPKISPASTSNDTSSTATVVP